MTTVSLRQASLGLVLFCTACATTIPQASHIQMLPENSLVLDRCQVLGPVYADVSGWTLSNEQQWYQQAQEKVRNKAARQYPESDSVVFLYAQRHFMRLDGYGMAYRCAEQSMKTRPKTP